MKQSHLRGELGRPTCHLGRGLPPTPMGYETVPTGWQHLPTAVPLPWLADSWVLGPSPSHKRDSICPRDTKIGDRQQENPLVSSAPTAGGTEGREPMGMLGQ